MKVKDIMSRDAACCGPDASLRAVAAMMVEHDCSDMPVCDNGRKPIGIVTDRDIVCRLVAKGENPVQRTAKECMSSPVITCTGDMDLDECARLMERYEVRRLPVVDQARVCCGIVAQADLARKGPEASACCGIVAQADLARKGRRPVTAEVMEKVPPPPASAPSGAGARLAHRTASSGS